MCLSDLVQFINTTISTATNILNSDFSIAALGSFAGALGGALVTMWLVHVKAQDEDLLKEIRSINSASTSTFNILNTYVGFKTAHIKNLHENYFKQRKEVELALAGKSKVKEIEILFDLQTLLPPLVPTDLLQSLMTEKISLDPNSLNLGLTLLQTINSLHDSMHKRNEFIEIFKRTGLEEQEKLKWYFGFSMNNGVQDTSIKDSIESMSNLIDDSLFFADLLTKQFVIRGEKLKKKLGKKAPKISKPDFKEQIANGTIPNGKNYPDWVKIFEKENIKDS